MAKRPTDWQDRIEIENGKVTRILTAIYERGNVYCDIDIYKENEDGERWYRNVYQSSYAGYVVLFPGFPINTNRTSYYYDPEPAVEEDWRELDGAMHIGDSSAYISDETKGKIIMYHPDFRYVFKKYDFESLAEVMEKLLQWKKHPQIELMLATGFEKLAMSGTFYRLKKENQKKVLQFCRQHPEANFLGYNDLRRAMKASNPALVIKFYSLVDSWLRKDITEQDFAYLERKGFASRDGLSYFLDYLSMVRQNAHNDADPYWRYPNDLVGSHARLVEERNTILELRRQAEAQAEKNKYATFRRVMKKYKKYDSEIDGYTVYFSDSLRDWEKQAKTLHQCIVRADYIKKVAQRRCLIVFIRKNDEPIATAELLPGKEIGQFYGNELDRNNCYPSDEVRAIFNRWLENVEIKKSI